MIDHAVVARAARARGLLGDEELPRVLGRLVELQAAGGPVDPRALLAPVVAPERLAPLLALWAARGGGAPAAPAPRSPSAGEAPEGGTIRGRLLDHLAAGNVEGDFSVDLSGERPRPPDLDDLTADPRLSPGPGVRSADAGPARGPGDPLARSGVRPPPPGEAGAGAARVVPLGAAVTVRPPAFAGADPGADGEVTAALEPPAVPFAPPPVDAALAPTALFPPADLPAPAFGSSPAPQGGPATVAAQPSGARFPAVASRGDAPTRADAGDAGPLRARPAAPQPRRGADPRRIGPYEVERELARGGMGVVYVARHVELGRRVALKVLLAGADATPQQLERFRLEASAAARLRHPGIVGVHEVGDDALGPFFAMDLIDGPTLAEVLRDRGPLPPREAARHAKALAEAVGYAHEHAVLHRDIKPANVLLAGEQPVLTDFGLAKDVGGADGGTVAGQVLGTPEYMSPEQAAGEVDRVDRRTDVYALGATLYEMLTGEPPFGGGSPVAIITAVLQRAPAPPSRAVPGLDRDLETICLKCLEKEPEARYASAQRLAADLGRWLDDRPIAARPPTAGERLRRWGRAHRGLVRLGAAAALALVGVGAWGLVAVTRTRTEAAVREQVARERARDEAREELVAAARAEAERAAAEAAAEAAPATARDGAARRRALERRVGAALRALGAAGRWQALAPADPAARGARHRAALGLGEATLEAEQWLLAAQAFEEAAALEVDVAAARAGLARVEEARGAEARRRAAVVEEALRDVEAGELPVEDAEHALARVVDGAALARLAAALGELTLVLRAVERTVLLQAIEVRDAGALERALDAQARAPLRAPPSAADAELIARARRRLEERAGSKRHEGFVQVEGARPATWRVLVASAQEEALGPRARVARLACAVLGRAGASEGDPAVSRDALAGYLAAEASPERAVEAAVALCRLGDAESARLVLASFPRFASATFQARVRPYLARLDVRLEVGGDESDAAAHARLGLDLLRQRRHAEARAAFERALELAPGDVEALRGRARALWAEGDRRGALADFSLVVQLDPQDLQSLADRARLRRELGDARGALADHDLALKRVPGELRHLVGRAQLQLEVLNDLELALADANEAVERHPGEAIAWHLRGVVRLRRGDRGGALADLERSLELDPEGHEGSDFAFAADALLALGRPADAAAMLERGLTRRPEHSKLLELRAMTRAATGDLAGARRDLEAVTRLQPDDAPAWANLGALLVNQGEHGAGIAALERAAELAPEEEKLVVNLARALEVAGEPARALAAVEAGRARIRRPTPGLRLMAAQLRAATGDRAGALADLDRMLARPGLPPQLAEAAQRLREQLAR